MQKNMTAHGETLEVRALFVVEFVGEFFANGETLIGEANGWRRHIREFQFTVSLERQLKTRHGSRHGNGTVADHGGFVVELAIRADVHVACGFAGGHLTVIDKAGAAISETDEHESTTADVSRGRLDNSESESNGNGSVNRVATALQNLDASLRAELFIGRDHAMRGARR